MKKKTQKNVLNRLTKSIMTKKNQHKQMENKTEDSGKHTTEKFEKNLQSNVESGTLEEFMQLANLSKKKFDAIKDQTIISNEASDFITKNQTNKIFLNNILKDSEMKTTELKPLSIPRRPKWNDSISAKEFDRLEREAFLNWRRSLAIEEEKNIKLVITPFEKNLEVWKQLWLVTEKADLLVQIVDARNPNFFRSEDLEQMIKEMGNKEYFLLVNKADLLNNKMRKHWSDFLIEKGVKYAFFSALFEQKKIEEIFPNEKILEDIDKVVEDEEEDEEEEEIKNANMFQNLKKEGEENDIEDEEEENEDENEGLEKESEIKESIEPKNTTNNVLNNLTQNNVEDDIKSSKKEDTVVVLDKKTEIVENKKGKDQINEISSFDETIRIYNREELIELFKTKLAKKPKVVNSTYHIVGFVGYPNVGKSSVINVLLNEKKVSVASMPGKTKHFQTLFLESHKELCLMDCPGLVFPSFTFSKAEMYVNGVLPIDQITDYLSPVALIIQRIPRINLENHYKIKLPDIYSASQFLQIYATKRGFYTGRALPNEAKAARLILKDYVSGILLYVNSRPDYDKKKHSEVENYHILSEGDYENEIENKEIIKQIPANFDDNLEKLGIEVSETKKTIEFNQLDEEFFAEKNVISKDFRVTKDIRRLLKFAVKRGDITEDEFESIMNGEDIEKILKKLEKNDKRDKKSLVQIEVTKK